MDSKQSTRRLDATLPQDVARAAKILGEGGLVAFPTETVYGLGANAFSAAAVEAIFVAKQRPHWDPLIVHVADRRMLDSVAIASPAAERLMAAFWPGPLTLLLPRTEAVPDIVTANRKLVGVRIPAHPISQELIRAAAMPIAAPSANRFGHTSPTTAAHVLADLDGRIDAVLDGGATTVGLESTVAGWTADGVVIYRPGAITFQMLEAVVGTGKVELYSGTRRSPGDSRSLPSPGMDLRHYAPRAQLKLVCAARGTGSRVSEIALSNALERARLETEAVAVMLPEGWSPGLAKWVFAWGRWSDGEMLARRLFSGLRELDDAGAEVIVCPVPAKGGIGDALRDRLEKAARSV